jgi:2-polyprenyl-3-methyl-5-hydroxy-6-metoxy-1,4-benzoquinol methylase
MKAEKFFDKMANQFDKRARNFEQPPVEKTKKYLNLDDIVLDYGCATGTVTIGIADEVKKVQGIDISSKMIDMARKKADDCQIENIDFAQATIFDDGMNRESFDVILAFNILHFLEDTPQVIQRINELLKPGGLIISATSCMGEKTFKNILQLLLFSPLIKLGIVPT